MAYQLQVSAKILSWPRQCACCGGEANAELRAAASRTTGKRVQHTTTSWWHVPYCNSCLHHKAQYDEASKWAGRAIAGGLGAWVLIAWLTGSGWLCCLYRSRMLRLLASEQGTRRSAETDVRKLLGTFGRSALCGLARHISHFCLRKQDISRKLYGLQLSQDDVRCTPTMTRRSNTSFVWDGFAAPQLER